MAEALDAVELDVARDAADFEQILELQRRNHVERVDPSEHSTQGFVYARHSVALLQAMAERLPQVVARRDGRVVGYTLAMVPAMRDALPELVPMFEQFDRTLWRGRPLGEYRYMVGGQVCVDAAERGRGLLAALYRECRRRLPPGYELCVTEVSERNQVSLRAHLRMGFVEASRYRDVADDWHVVVWDFASH